MRNEILAAGALLAATLAAATPAAATVTFGEAKVTGKADAYARHDPTTQTQTATTLPTSPLAQTLSSYASAHGSSARAQGSVSFADEANGEMDLAEIYAGSRWLNEYPSGAAASFGLRYTFTIDQSYLLRFDYDLDLDPRASVDLFLYKGATKVTSSDFAAGQGFLFTDPIGPGAYTLVLEANSYAQSSETLAEEYNTATGRVGFSLLRNGRQPTSAAPEPTTWALMIAGFGMAGAGLRRRGTRRGPTLVG